MNKSIPPALTPAEALMTVAVLATAADNYYSTSEMERLRAMTWIHPLFKNIDSTDHFIAQRFVDLQTRGRDVLMKEASQVLNSGLREMAFAWATELVHTDNVVVEMEHIFLDKLAVHFGIPGPLARKIRVVTAIRRRAV